MAETHERNTEILDAWLDQLELSIKQLGFLRGFHLLSAEERRPGDEYDSFFYSRAQMDLINSQVYLQLVALEWARAKAGLELGNIGPRRLQRLRSLENALRSSLNTITNSEHGAKAMF